MDHKEQHRQKHMKEREHEKQEHNKHASSQESVGAL
jgi:hypothetical protein